MAQEELNFKKIIPIAVIIVVVIVLIAFGSRMTTTIEAGHAGVLFRTFGGGIDTERTFGEGFHLLAPWNSMYIYETRQQEVAETMNVLSSNGLEISADVSVWYLPTYDEIGLLHSKIGLNYTQRVVIPALRASTRSVIGRYTPEEIYSTNRDVIQDEIYTETISILEGKHVQINKVLIRSIVLPPTIKQAIESKLKQEQESLEYEFKLEKAQKEAQRQRIDAEGKAVANRILSESLTDKILREKGIEATLRLAESPNAKVVVIGNSEGGLPIILGDSK
ncbi:MAG: prohibitin family protein [Bacteroidales bacterium]|jgi:regulator of protease activity HflC (stomatin/prohibitin superfamily)|nr:prohibitin family protein [Bacteroidales bacterium]MDD4177782.1 prohibitin family protein [Bacteroidales bacterium]MDD4742146.1 prohibitin family protein [Bacteroidales bacterium]MDY0335975.1 prohibitin family protein [Bacteroidales bacterium]NCU35746.1 prohibitin family protein [Candidatus Falkowbacteria bacterium]